MTWTADDVMQDRADCELGYDQDVSCSNCGDAAIVRFRDGEPTDEAQIVCHCGGEYEVI